MFPFDGVMHLKLPAFTKPQMMSRDLMQINKWCIAGSSINHQVIELDLISTFCT